MRRDYAQFTERGAEVVIVGPDGPRAFQRMWAKEGFPFVGLADPQHRASSLYKQEVNLLKLGRMPAVVVVNKEGYICYAHYANSMSDIPPNDEILSLLDALESEPA